MRPWPSPAAQAVFAHQGGWDELLLVAGPLVAIGVALWLANRRVSAQLGNDGSATENAANNKSAGKNSANQNSAVKKADETD